jgi:hypothetical protein
LSLVEKQAVEPPYVQNCGVSHCVAPKPSHFTAAVADTCKLMVLSNDGIGVDIGGGKPVDMLCDGRLTRGCSLTACAGPYML